MRLAATILGALALTIPPATLARGRGTAGAAATASRGGAASSTGCAATGRHSTGGRPDEPWQAIRRGDFQRRAPCPSTGATRGACPGWEIVDVPPAARGEGWTLRWATTEEAERVRAESPWTSR